MITIILAINGDIKTMIAFAFELITDIAGEIINSKKAPKLIRVMLLTILSFGLIGLFIVLTISGFNKGDMFLILFCLVCTILFILAYIFMLHKICKK